jgi:hypothetical protein
MDVKIVKSKSIYGIGQVRLTSKKVLVKMDGGESYEIEKENAPDGIEAGRWNLALNATGDKIFSYRPLSGTFTAKFLKFAAAPDTLPVAVLEESKYKDEHGNIKIGTPRLMFTAVILVADQYEFPVKMPYRFDEGDSGNTTIAYRKMSKRLETLLDFLNVTGVKEKAIPFTDNILPALEEMILDESREFLVSVENGWIASFSPPLSQPKKAKAKAKKK